MIPGCTQFLSINAYNIAFFSFHQNQVNLFLFLYPFHILLFKGQYVYVLSVGTRLYILSILLVYILCKY